MLVDDKRQVTMILPLIHWEISLSSIVSFKVSLVLWYRYLMQNGCDPMDSKKLLAFLILLANSRNLVSIGYLMIGNSRAFIWIEADDFYVLDVRIWENPTDMISMIGDRSQLMSYPLWQCSSTSIMVSKSSSKWRISARFITWKPIHQPHMDWTIIIKRWVSNPPWQMHH